jgi:hypothetical protein
MGVVSRRDVFRRGGLIAAGVASGGPAPATPTIGQGSEIYTRIGVSWTLPLTAGEVGRMLLEGEPRIMSHAEGESKSFLIRPVAMKPGEHKIVARRLHEICSSAGSRSADKTSGQPVQDISGSWDVEIRYEVGAARHKLFLTAKGNRVAGSHEGWAFQGDLKGEVSGDQVMLRSSLPAEGNNLTYVFRGAVTGQEISGDVDLGEYGRAKFHAHRHA